MTRALFLPLCAVLAMSTACDDKKDADKDKKADGEKKDAAKEADAKEADAKEADAKEADAKEADAGGDVIKKSAADWFKEFIAVKGADMMNYMNKKVELTGKVKKVITEMDESQKLWLEAEGENYVSLQFTDKGAAAKEKKLAEGAEVTALCGIGGSDPNGKYVMMTECELK